MSATKKINPYGLVKYKSIDEYHAAFPKDVQQLLQTMRETIHQCAPKATEVISYNMPAFKLNTNLVYYAAYKKHIGFYPTASPLKIFEAELVNYKTSKGAIQFPLDKPIPKSLIKKIVKLRVTQDLEKIKKGK